MRSLGSTMEQGYSASGRGWQAATRTVERNDMSDPHPQADPGPDGEFCAWFGFWAQFVVLGLLAVIGAYVAGQGGEPGDYECGLLLCLAAVALAFMRLKSRLD